MPQPPNTFLQELQRSNARIKSRRAENDSSITSMLASLSSPDASATAQDATAASPTAPVGASGAGTVAPGAVATSPGDLSRGQNIVNVARKYIGVPYVAGGRTPKSGMDCSGYTSYVLREAIGLNIEALSGTQARDSRGKNVGNLNQAQPGDLLFFDLGARDTWNGIDHVAIYLGNGRMIEAPRPGKNIYETKVYATPKYIKRF